LGGTEPILLIRSCYTVPAMKAIRYGIHFTTLTVAAVIFWLVKDLCPLCRSFNFDLFHYALMGALHATCIVVSLRERRTIHRALGFITLAAVLSVMIPLMALVGSAFLIPFANMLRENQLGADAIMVIGSAIGASGYWLLVQLFWLKSLRRAGGLEPWLFA